MSGTRHNAFLTASLVTTMLLTTTWAQAQEPRHGDDQWEEWQQEAAEEALANESDVDALEALMMDIDDLREHPINLNAATKAELLRLSFLNEVQVNAIIGDNDSLTGSRLAPRGNTHNNVVYSCQVTRNVSFIGFFFFN